MKTKEELNALKAEVETVNRKLRELTGDELKQVTGGDVEFLYCEYLTPTQCILDAPERTMDKCRFCPAKTQVLGEGQCYIFPINLDGE